ncbi:hypothetical protein HOY82DRAFT_539759 [Tuber indicum]|nr:hypothetical protein HOY82DRAFT_539759 [Tuber indicum]
MDNMPESQYPNQSQYPESNPLFQTQEEWEFQMLQFNPPQPIPDHSPQQSSFNQIVVTNTNKSTMEQCRFSLDISIGKDILARSIGHLKRSNLPTWNNFEQLLSSKIANDAPQVTDILQYRLKSYAVTITATTPKEVIGPITIRGINNWDTIVEEVQRMIAASKTFRDISFGVQAEYLCLSQGISTSGNAIGGLGALTQLATTKRKNATLEQLEKARNTPKTDFSVVFKELRDRHRCIEPLSSGERCQYEQETFITTPKSKFHLHLSYNDVAEWARMVIKEEAVISNPPYQLPRFQTPPPAAPKSSRKRKSTQAISYLYNKQHLQLLDSASVSNFSEPSRKRPNDSHSNLTIHQISSSPLPQVNSPSPPPIVPKSRDRLASSQYLSPYTNPIRSGVTRHSHSESASVSIPTSVQAPTTTHGRIPGVLDGASGDLREVLHLQAQALADLSASTYVQAELPEILKFKKKKSLAHLDEVKSFWRSIDVGKVVGENKLHEVAGETQDDESNKKKNSESEGDDVIGSDSFDDISSSEFLF